MLKRKSKSKRTNERTKRRSVGIYLVGDLTYVALPDLLLRLHEVSSPKSILERSDLDETLFEEWENKFAGTWRLDWLFHLVRCPSGHRPVYPETRRTLKETEFFVSNEEVKFRRHCTLEKLIIAARRADPDCPMLSNEGVFHYLRTYGKRLPWLSDFVRRGAEPPENTVVIPLNSVRRARVAWDYVQIMAEIYKSLREVDGKEREKPESVYDNWFRKDFFPADFFFEFVQWLYGGPEPDGWLIVSESLLKVRNERRDTQICRRAGFHKCDLHKLRSDPITSDIIDEAVKVAQSGHPGLEPKLSEFKQLDQLSQSRILNYAGEATWKASLNAAGMSEASLDQYKQKARKCVYQDSEGAICDSANDLMFFLDGDGKRPNGQGPAFNRSGVIAPRIFVPSPLQFRFREVAKRLSSEQRIAKLRQTLPYFERWFLDQVVPRVWWKRRERIGGKATGLKRAGGAYDDALPQQLLGRSAEIADTPAAAAADAEKDQAGKADGGPDGNKKWSFDARAATIGRLRVELRGQELALLEILYDARNHVADRDALRSAWDNGVADDDTVRKAIVRLRASLRNALRLPKTFDPIPSKGRGVYASWSLCVREIERAAVAIDLATV